MHQEEEKGDAPTYGEVAYQAGHREQEGGVQVRHQEGPVESPKNACLRTCPCTCVSPRRTREGRGSILPSDGGHLSWSMSLYNVATK